MNEFSLETRVYIEDTDAGGIVYYANYLKFMERARTEYMRALGFSKPALMSDSQLVVVQLDIKYLMPAMLDDTLRISVELKELKKGNKNKSRNKSKAIYKPYTMLTKFIFKIY